MSQAQTILIALKNVLKSKGLTYTALAQELKLNETSVKRLMTGRVPMTLERLEQVCELVGIEVYDLLRLAKPQGSQRQAQLSIEQEQALADDPHLFVSFYGLAKGFTVTEIVSKYRINQNAAQKGLFQLEKLGLIDVLSGNRVKFRVPRSIRWQQDGPLSKRFEKEMESDFLESDFSESTEFRKFVTVPLSERSRPGLIRKLRELHQSIEEMSEVDLAVEKDLKQTATLLIGFREWTPRLLNKFLR